MARGLGAAQITIVLRHDDSALAAELDRLNFPRQDRITNPHPDRGMFSSIVCAANWQGWRSDILRWAIALGVLLVIGRFTLISSWLSFLNRFAL